jgi:hypothetical protein
MWASAKRKGRHTGGCSALSLLQGLLSSVGSTVILHVNGTSGKRGSGRTCSGEVTFQRRTLLQANLDHLFQMANKKGSLAPSQIEIESVQELYFTLNGIPRPPKELLTQLQAMKTMKTMLHKIYETSDVSLDVQVTDVIQTVVEYCTAVKESVDEFSRLGSQEWTAFRYGHRDFAGIAERLRTDLCTIFIGCVDNLRFV